MESSVVGYLGSRKLKNGPRCSDVLEVFADHCNRKLWILKECVLGSEYCTRCPFLHYSSVNLLTQVILYQHQELGNMER